MVFLGSFPKTFGCKRAAITICYKRAVLNKINWFGEAGLNRTNLISLAVGMLPANRRLAAVAATGSRPMVATASTAFPLWRPKACVSTSTKCCFPLAEKGNTVSGKPIWVPVCGIALSGCIRRVAYTGVCEKKSLRRMTEDPSSSWAIS